MLALKLQVWYKLKVLWCIFLVKLGDSLIDFLLHLNADLKKKHSSLSEAKICDVGDWIRPRFGCSHGWHRTITVHQTKPQPAIRGLKNTWFTIKLWDIFSGWFIKLRQKFLYASDFVQNNQLNRIIWTFICNCLPSVAAFLIVTAFLHEKGKHCKRENVYNICYLYTRCPVSGVSCL